MLCFFFKFILFRLILSSKFFLGWWHPSGQTQDPKSTAASLAPRKCLAYSQSIVICWMSSQFTILYSWWVFFFSFSPLFLLLGVSLNLTLILLWWAILKEVLDPVKLWFSNEEHGSKWWSNLKQHISSWSYFHI